MLCLLPAPLREVIRNTQDWQELMRFLPFSRPPRNHRRTTEIAATSAPRKTSTPPASMKSSGA
jgi:hypothetical protein